MAAIREMSLSDGAGNDASALRIALARAVGGRKVPDSAIASVAKKLAATKYKIRGIDVCISGICIDYFFDNDQWYKALPELLRPRDARTYGIELFPYGIPWPELFRVRVQQEFDEMAGLRQSVPAQGLDRLRQGVEEIHA